MFNGFQGSGYIDDDTEPCPNDLQGEVLAAAETFILEKFNLYSKLRLEKLFINNELKNVFEAISRFLELFFLEFRQ